jgi:hypothetical protein
MPGAACALFGGLLFARRANENTSSQRCCVWFQADNFELKAEPPGAKSTFTKSTSSIQFVLALTPLRSQRTNRSHADQRGRSPNKQFTEFSSTAILEPSCAGQFRGAPGITRQIPGSQSPCPRALSSAIERREPTTIRQGVKKCVSFTPCCACATSIPR